MPVITEKIQINIDKAIAKISDLLSSIIFIFFCNIPSSCSVVKECYKVFRSKRSSSIECVAAVDGDVFLVSFHSCI